MPPNLLAYYSNIVLVLNIFPLGHAVNTALYLSNWLCFLGNAVIMLRNPNLLTFQTKDEPLFNWIPIPILHFFNQGYHIFPLFIFRNRQTITETLSYESILISAIFFLSYLVFFSEQIILENYLLDKKQVFIIAGGFGIFTLLFSYLFSILRKSNEFLKNFR
jgi:hypothetical protein